MPHPGVAPFVRHAQRFGIDCVMQTAAEFGFLHSDLCVLLSACDDVERKGVRRPKSYRLTIEERVDRLLGIEPENKELA